MDAASADADAAATAEFESRFRTAVVDVNRSSKGSPTGGVSRFSAMVVAGNGRGVLGLGVGRAAEASDAVRKATRASLRTLFFVPRHARAGPLAPSTAWHGGVKVTVFPLPTGAGVRAPPLAAGVCRLAGVTDVGVKYHGSRCTRNMVKALIRALEGAPTLADATLAAATAAGVKNPAAWRARELAVGAPRAKGRRVAGVAGEWYI